MVHLKELMRIMLLLSGLSFVRGCDIRINQERSYNFSVITGVPEFNYSSSWYFICHYDADRNSDVLCRYLGCQSSIGFVLQDHHPQSVELYCYGREESTCSCTSYTPRFCLRLGITCYSGLPQIRNITSEETRFEVNLDRVSCLSDYYNYRVACQLDNHVIPVEKNINDTTIVIFEDVYPYTQYTCYVKVYDDNDTLQYNDTSHITGQTLPVVPTPPQMLHVSPLSSSAILSWNLPQFPNGTSLNYSVNCSADNLNHPIKATSYLSQSISVHDLFPFTNYNCCISATNSIGEGRPTCMRFLTSESSPTQAPQALNASVISPHHAFLLWEPPEERQRNGHIRKYHIEVDSEDGLVNYTSIQENFNLTSLHPYYIYTVRIAAVTVEEGPHASLAFQTHEAAPSAPPQISNVMTFATSFQLELKPPPAENQNGIIVGYEAVVVKTSNGFKTNTTLQITEVQLKVEELSPLTTYSYQVAAYTSAGVGPFTEPTAIMTRALKEGTPSSVIIYVGIGLTTVFILALIAVIAVVIMILLSKNRQQERYEVEEFDMKLSDETKETGDVKPKEKPDRQGEKKKKWRKKEKVSNKYEAPPTHCVLHDTSFITDANFDLFVDKKVEEDNISGSSSMILELPQRQYLDDEEFTKELFPKPLSIRALLESSGASNSHDEHVPQQIMVKSTSHFINKKNFNLFVETKTTPDNISIDDDYEGTVPELPQRGYLEGEDVDEVPQLPDRKYTDEDVRNINVLRGSEGSKVPLVGHRKHANTYIYTPPSVSTISGRTQSSGMINHRSSQKTSEVAESAINRHTRIAQANKKPQSHSTEDDSQDDYTPLDPSTLNQRPAAMSELADVYMVLTKNSDGRQTASAEQQKDPDYMSLRSENPKGIKESSYMSLKRTVTGNSDSDDDEYSYTPLNPSTMSRETAALAYSVGLNNAVGAMESSSSSGSGYDNNKGPHTSLRNFTQQK